MTGVGFAPALLPLSLLVALISVIPLALTVFGLVKRMHGTGFAIAHVFFLFVLSFAFFAGPILLPLLLHGDVNRLFSDESS